MALELIPLQPEHVPELARICHDAFASLHDRHGVPRDIADVDTAEMILSHVAGRPDYTGVVAVLDGRPVGSNFLLHADPIAGVGPITVDPALQSRGVGRELMRWVLGEAERRGIRATRLFQEAINTTSLALYSRLGFAWRGTAAAMQPTAAPADDPAIRPLSAADLVEVRRLSAAAYGFSRAGDAAGLLAGGIPGFGRERDGRLVGYRIVSLFGHAAAETEDDLLALIAHSARHVPAPMAVFLCPLHHTDLFRRALEAGHRTLKQLSYMSYGEYAEPPGVYLPSIQC
ncbi:GNAT family N-acetyltransferase [Vulcanococcus limneticus Candia 3F8]|uniref:GNAT family N-acetyltransferase n=1 Tax=Vulcanococcus limneticus TaxID=2170428 RepID=UPI000B98B1AE|nr:GNAT family N-acetyltransferase [Vulcanococcus limneticus]MCP9793603.1 GNAT family N-acetyltransferase [Vulcanococcus limneticus MW73D5]MCP9895491.1 GNAT family N-acetyltransferase [Vulcanococcus limneticus Candia 3F8]MCP9898939.1 GNAT family N-acetyltransferase [Vulcanococcus limneticus Candia 3B3]